LKEKPSAAAPATEKIKYEAMAVDKDVKPAKSASAKAASKQTDVLGKAAATKAEHIPAAAGKAAKMMPGHDTKQAAPLPVAAASSSSSSKGDGGVRPKKDPMGGGGGGSCPFAALHAAMGGDDAAACPVAGGAGAGAGISAEHRDARPTAVKPAGSKRASLAAMEGSVSGLCLPLAPPPLFAPPHLRPQNIPHLSSYSKPRAHRDPLLEAFLRSVSPSARHHCDFSFKFHEYLIFAAQRSTTGIKWNMRVCIPRSLHLHLRPMPQ
jgi:hypothetical protein